MWVNLLFGRGDWCVCVFGCSSGTKYILSRFLKFFLLLLELLALWPGRKEPHEVNDRASFCLIVIVFNSLQWFNLTPSATFVFSYYFTFSHPSPSCCSLLVADSCVFPSQLLPVDASLLYSNMSWQILLLEKQLTPQVGWQWTRCRICILLCRGETLVVGIPLHCRCRRKVLLMQYFEDFCLSWLYFSFYVAPLHSYLDFYQVTCNNVQILKNGYTNNYAWGIFVCVSTQMCGLMWGGVLQWAGR